MNKKLKVILGFFLFVYFAVYLFSLTFTKKPYARVHEKVIVAVASPLQTMITYTYEKISSTLGYYVFLVGTAKRNQNLEKENIRLQKELLHLKEVELENERLRKLASLPMPKKLSGILAERIAVGSNEFERSIRINKGFEHKVRVGMPVVDHHGVVGQIAEVFGNYATVLLLTDKSSAIDVIVQRTRARGILKGFTRDQLAFEFMAVDEDLQIGDVVISSGLDGVYPEGLMVGTVMALNKSGRRLFLTATIAPVVDFAKIEEVVLLEGLARE